MTAELSLTFWTIFLRNVQVSVLAPKTARLLIDELDGYQVRENRNELIKSCLENRAQILIHCKKHKNRVQSKQCEQYCLSIVIIAGNTKCSRVNAQILEQLECVKKI